MKDVNGSETFVLFGNGAEVMGSGHPKSQLEVVYDGDVFPRYIKRGCVQYGEKVLSLDLTSRLFQSLEHQPLTVSNYLARSIDTPKANVPGFANLTSPSLSSPSSRHCFLFPHLLIHHSLE